MTFTVFVCSIWNWTVQFIIITHISEKLEVGCCVIDYQIAVVAMQALRM
ncbi:hypothetical protein M758_2G124600 [Ceratodon purpureus]|nr:hypothetical protein M758_2G124600 [Ceratodon purpureus]